MSDPNVFYISILESMSPQRISIEIWIKLEVNTEIV